MKNNLDDRLNKSHNVPATIKHKNMDASNYRAKSDDKSKKQRPLKINAKTKNTKLNSDPTKIKSKQQPNKKSNAKRVIEESPYQKLYQRLQGKVNNIDTTNLKKAVKLTGAITVAFTGVGLVWFWHHINKQ